MGKKFQKFLLESLEKENTTLYSQDIENILQTLEPINMIRFALYCAKDVVDLNNQISMPTAKNCIQLIEKWLEDSKAVSTEELYNIPGLYLEWHDYSNTYVSRIAVSAVYAACYTVWSAIRFTSNNSFRASNTAADVSNAAWYAANAKVLNQNPNEDEFAQLMQQEIDNYKKILISRFTRKYKNPNDKLLNLATNDPHNQNEANLIFWDYILENDILQHFTEIGDDGMISFNLMGIHLTGQSLNDLENQIINNKELFNNIVNTIRSIIRK